jgi:acetylornithine deacetylase/succinyl-diaminopimelate desuccinylase-like protein
MKIAATLLSALYLSGAVLPAVAADDGGLARFRANYKMLVETNTTHSAGDCTLAANRLADQLRKVGYPDSDVHVVIAPDHPKEASLVAVLHGTDPKAKALLLLGHIDTVEAKREDWTRDPFKLVEEGGYFYARGASDDKAMSSINLDTMIRLKEEGYKPRRDVKWAATCGEEIFGSFPGALDGWEYLLHHDRELVDAGIALNEGAGGRMDENGKHLAVEIQSGEKFYMDYKLVLTGPGGHSGRPLPPPQDLIWQMADAIKKVDEYKFPLNVLPAVRGTFDAMSKLTPGAEGQAMAAVAKPNPDLKAVELLSKDPNYASMMRTTCVATMVNAGHSPNALAQHTEVNVNCRLLPGDKPDQVLAVLKKVVGNDKMAINYGAVPGPAPDAPPLTPELMATVKKNAEAIWPGVVVMPVLSTGSTDGSFSNGLGVPTYGLSGIFHKPGGDGVHGLNERVLVQSLYDARKFLYGVTKDLSK